MKPNFMSTPSRSRLRPFLRDVALRLELCHLTPEPVEALLRSLRKQPSSLHGGSRPRVSPANSSRRSRAFMPTIGRRGRAPRSRFSLASPRPEPCSMSSSQDGFSTSPILRSGRNAPSGRPLCGSRWLFSPRAWSRPSPTTACPAASASRVLPICPTTGPSQFKMLGLQEPR